LLSYLRPQDPVHGRSPARSAHGTQNRRFCGHMRTTGYLYTGAIQKQKSTKLRNDVTTASMLTKLILHTRIKPNTYAEFPVKNDQ